MSADDDAMDVDGVLAGDLTAFERIVRRWQGPLVNLAYRFCRDRGRAEDLAQEAFLRAYRGLGRWRREAAFSTWLFALATNVFRSELRRLPPPSVSFDLVAEPSSGDERKADVQLEAEDRDRVIRRVVDTLPPKYREALILFYFRDMDVAAAAASLGVPVGTVKARLSRARDLLRRKLPPGTHETNAPRLTEA
jgi:RNA polymerase sigma-70 factor, ECF subfamily